MAIFQDMVKCPDSNGAHQYSSVLLSLHPLHDCRCKDSFFGPILFECSFADDIIDTRRLSVCAVSNDRVETALLAACRIKASTIYPIPFSLSHHIELQRTLGIDPLLVFNTCVF